MRAMQQLRAQQQIDEWRAIDAADLVERPVVSDLGNGGGGRHRRRGPILLCGQSSGPVKLSGT
jgi:hypothetical protein